MTKMVLGYGCMSKHSNISDSRVTTDKAVREATSRIASFKFVGLQEKWLESICLFNFIMTGQRVVELRQTGFVHPGVALGSLRAASVQMLKVHRYDPSLLGPNYLDEADTAIYEYARERFEYECSKHNISEATCPYEISEPER